ncbi:hypothetical protein [Sphingomonas sp. LM7]|uniref:hypothetical protein n=1 Tax=Sphingomonas sp. LM7 TaxID=1938607 RepID=UPI0012370D14|nr:hypothetical protein [Sphingomonas sp. LM7]
MPEVVSAVFAGLAVAVSLWVMFQTTRSQRSATTIDIWKVWISKEYRAYRVRAYNLIKDAKEAGPVGEAPRFAPLLEDPDAEEAIGSVEHFFAEVDSAISSGMLNNRLFGALFGRSVCDWQYLLLGFDRRGADAFSDSEIGLIFGRLEQHCKKSGEAHVPITSRREAQLIARDP